ncbi:MAG: DUF4330 domain-containing protein [Epulopiscium sp.]|nr:DUF4330 domain-containing protein [Candidatus Epulonipiscium sp.]
MKFIDDKGKIFGFINVIDLIALLVLLVLVLGIGYRAITKKSTLGGNSASEQEIIYTVRATEQIPQIADGLQVGDQLFAKGNFVNAKITSVTTESAKVFVETAEGEIKVAEHPQLQDIVFTIEATVIQKGPILEIGGQEIRIGAHHWVKNQTTQASGLIESIEFIKR